jgi:hypothetical protein
MENPKPEKSEGNTDPSDDVVPLPPEHPLARVFGSRRGDPSLDRMMEGIADYRRRIARQEAAAERAAKHK